MSDKPHSKRSLDIVTTKQGARSKRRPDTDFGITTKDLTGFFMPLYTYSWKGYGHNNALFHTMRAMTYVDINGSGNTTGLQEKGGDCTMLSCLPGRQVYAEFNALPLMNVYESLTTYHASTNTNRGTYGGYARSFMSLVDRAFSYNNLWPATMGTSTGNAVSQMLPVGSSVNAFSTLFAQASARIMPNSSQAADLLLLTKMLDAEFCYEGGSQTHKFTNVTSLPVYIEVREFMPRVKLSDNIIYDTFGTASNGHAAAVPGLRDTLYADLARQKNRLAGLSDGAYPEALDLFDQLDDKKFKYNKYCKITNARWVVGEPVRHRIDPGHTWTYTMVLPACKVKTSELFEFVQKKVNTTSNTTSTDNQQTFLYQGVPLESSSVDIGNTNYSPKFSKFIQVRATGSAAFTTGAPGTGVSAIPQWDAMEAPPSEKDKLAAGFSTSINPFTNVGFKTATHAVGLMHTMSENHAMRVKPLMPKAHRDEYSYLPNSAGRTNITQGDEMGQLDPADNAIQDVAMDN